jgi:hypothetical protein
LASQHATFDVSRVLGEQRHSSEEVLEVLGGLRDAGVHEAAQPTAGQLSMCGLQQSVSVILALCSSDRRTNAMVAHPHGHRERATHLGRQMRVAHLVVQ